MPDHTISIKTQADVSGLQQIHRQMDAIHELAKQISKTGIQLPQFGQAVGQAGGPGGGFIPPPSAGAQAKEQQRAQAVVGSRVPGATSRPLAGGAFPTGEQYGEWLVANESILAPFQRQAAQEAGVSGGGPGGARTAQRTRYVVKPGTITIPPAARKGNAGWKAPVGSQDYMQAFFDAAGAFVPEGSQARLDWQRAQAAQAQGIETGVAAFYRKYAPEENMIPVPAAGGAGGKPPRNPFLRGLAGGRGGGAVGREWSAEGLAGAAGGLASRFLPLTPLAIGGAATALGVGSFKAWMASGTELSPLTKSITTAGDSLQDFQKKVLGAGAALDYLPNQVARVATTLGVGLGHVGTQRLVGLSAQTFAFARAYGLPAESVAQGFVQAGRLGLTMGPGSQLTNAQLMAAIGASSWMSGAQGGRIGELMQEFLTVAKQIENTAVIVPNQLQMLGMITQMNRQLPVSLQYGGGAQLINKISQGIASPGLGTPGIAMGMAATGLNYPQYSYLQDMGPFATIPWGPHKGQMQLQAYMNFLRHNFAAGAKFGNAASGYLPENNQAQILDMIMKMYWHLSGPETGALFSLNPSQWGTLGKQLSSLGLSTSNVTPNQLIWWSKAAGATSQTSIQALAKQMQHYGASFSPHLQQLLSSRNIPQEQKGLEQYILGHPGLKPLTTPQSIGALTASIKTAQITITGKVVNTIAGKPGTGPQSPIEQRLSQQAQDLANAKKWQAQHGPIKGTHIQQWNEPWWQKFKDWWYGVDTNYSGGGISYTPAGLVAAGVSGASSPGVFSYFSGPNMSPAFASYGSSAAAFVQSAYGQKGRFILDALSGQTGTGIASLASWGSRGSATRIRAAGRRIIPPYFASAFQKAGVPAWLATGVETWEGGGSPWDYIKDANGAYSVGPLQLNLKGQASGYSLQRLLGNSALQEALGIPPILKAYRQGLSLGIPDRSEALFRYVLGNSGHPDYTGLPPGYGAHTDQVWQELARDLSSAAKDIKDSAQQLRASTTSLKTRPGSAIDRVNRNQTTAIST